MKSFKEFKKDEGNLDSDKEFKILKSELRKISEKNEPSEQEQRWAWTRLEARLFTSVKENSSFLWIRAMGWCSILLIAAWMGFSFYGSPLGFAPKVTLTSPDLSAVYFYSKDAAADVIWVSGYDYLPQDYAIR